MRLLNGFVLAALLALAAPIALSDSGYWLRVTTDKLNVRSRPDMNALRVSQVALDETLRGVEQLSGWHKIVPPENTFCYVFAKNVNQKTPGRGVVEVSEGSTLVVHAGSNVQDVNPRISEKQTLLPPGAEVEIVGQEGEWYRIKPPPGVYVYIVSDYVEKVTGDQAADLDRRHADLLERERRAQLQQSQATASAPAEPAAGDAESLEPIRSMDEEGPALASRPSVAGVTAQQNGRNGVHEMQPLVDSGTPTNQPSSQESPAETSPERSAEGATTAPAERKADETAGREGSAEPSPELQNRLRKAQDLYNTQNQLSPVLRNWAPVLEEYRVLAAQNESPLFADVARKRIREIERRQQDDEFLQKTDQVSSRHWSTVNSPGLPPVRERVPLEPTPTSMPYHDARGILRHAGLPEGIGTNVVARLVDPYTGQVTAYVDPAASNLGPLEGKYVAIRGTWSKSASGQSDVLRVQQIFVLPLNMRGVPGSR